MKILHFADLHLGVETYGHIDPATGLSSRQTDFLKVFDEIVDYALDSKIDLVLFCGDAYKSREPTQTQQREFARRIRRLSEGGIPVFMLTGNHDLPNTSFRATSTEIFDTLGVDKVIVATKPDKFVIQTASGPIQIVSLPWPRKSALLTREETKNLTFEQLKERIENALTGAIAKFAAELDPNRPAILVAHIWVANAKVGSENRMTIGQEPSLLLSNVAIPAFDYVALGHIHRRQVLAEDPPVVYAGSPERIDFGEEDSDKGFYIIEITTDKATGKRETHYEFHETHGRRFLTIAVTIADDDFDPTGTILAEVAKNKDKINDAIVRVEIELTASASSFIRDAEIRDCLKEASYFTIARTVRRETRQRLAGKSAEEITPLDALKAYFEDKKVSPERMKQLMEYGDRLIRAQAEKQ
jgi:exonuclease SbcD